MTPAILSRDGKLFMSVGTPGGRRIINTVLQVIVNVVDFGMNIQEAIDAPRVHHHAGRGGGVLVDPVLHPVLFDNVFQDAPAPLHGADGNRLTPPNASRRR